MSRDRSNPAKFPSTAVPLLLDEMQRLGARAERDHARRSSAARACSATLIPRRRDQHRRAKRRRDARRARRARRSRSSPRTRAATTDAASILYRADGPRRGALAAKGIACPLASRRRQALRVLVVDDSAFMRRMTSQIIEASRRVHGRRHGAQRLRRAEADSRARSRHRHARRRHAGARWTRARSATS